MLSLRSLFLTLSRPASRLKIDIFIFAFLIDIIIIIMCHRKNIYQSILNTLISIVQIRLCTPHTPWEPPLPCFSSCLSLCGLCMQIPIFSILFSVFCRFCVSDSVVFVYNLSTLSRVISAQWVRVGLPQIWEMFPLFPLPRHILFLGVQQSDVCATNTIPVLFLLLLIPSQSIYTHMYISSYQICFIARYVSPNELCGSPCLVLPLRFVLAEVSIVFNEPYNEIAAQRSLHCSSARRSRYPVVLEWALQLAIAY